MKAHLVLVAIVAGSVGVSAQQANRPAVAPLKPGEVAVIGCLMREADYRALNKEGAGGVLGTGVGVGNEYVLAQARPVTPTATAATDKIAAKDYGLTGALEKNLATEVGRMVEVVDMVKEESGKLPQLTASLSHPVGDFCPAGMRGTGSAPRP